MFCNIKNLNFNNILFYFLLILIILATGIIVKKYTNIYEGFDESDAEKINENVKNYNNSLDKEIEKLENITKYIDDDIYNDKITKLKKICSLEIKEKFYKNKFGPKNSEIEKLLKTKEMLDKISNNDGGVSSVSNSVPKTGGYF